MTAALVITLVVALALARRVVADSVRMRLVAEAEHELRGPLQAIAFAVDGPDAALLKPELERARTALADLAAARSGKRSAAERELIQLDRLVWSAATASDLVARRAGGGVHLDWSAGSVAIRADRGRVSQALGNLLANAIEHGGGQVRVIGRRTRRGVRVEVRDSGRGHGLAIAAQAVRESGGSLSAARAGSGTAVALELPIADAEANAPTANAPTAGAPTAGAPTAGAPTAGAPTAGADPPPAA